MHVSQIQRASSGLTAVHNASAALVWLHVDAHSLNTELKERDSELMVHGAWVMDGVRCGVRPKADPMKETPVGGPLHCSLL